MLYYLAEWSQNLSALNVFRYITFRAGGAFFTALVFGFLFGRPLIEILRVRQGRGQPIRSDGPEGHLITKKGTPTMGGLLILSALLVSTLLWARWSNGYIWMVTLVTLGFGLIGFADDYAKVSKQTHAGVPGRVRLAAGFAIAALAAAWAMYLHPADLSGQLAFPVFKELLWDLGWFFIPFAVLVIVGAANAVNLTDGLDGLAIMPVMIAAGSLGVIAYAVGRVDFTNYLGVHYVPETGELLVFVAALIGGGLGFLWYNAPPAAVFMGDTGSLALGGALGAIAVATKHEIVLAIIGGLFVVEALSVIIQVAYYKRTGRRVFLMAPIHHHFEKLGWKEPQIVIRFWIVSLILAIIGLATLKLDDRPQVIPTRGYAGHKVAVLGLGRSGRPAVASLRAGGAEVVAWDDNAAARAAAEADGIPLADLTRARSYEGVKALIVSPGIPHLYPAPHPAVAAAWDAGVAVDNDVGLFFRSFATPDWERFDRAPQVVAITGSNGKSTTTALTAHVLAAGGRPVQTGGNIGRGVLDLDPAEDGMVVVMELSSYQIELARALQPDVAVFLNLSPDHLDRHGGMGGYFAAKRRLFTQGGPSRSIIGVDENEGRFLANTMREEAGTGDPVIEISVTRKLAGPGWNVVARKGFLAEWRHGRQVASIDLRGMLTLPGAHNHQNACAAYAAARTLGLAPRQIEAALATYPGLAHRSQLVATWKGVRIVNDSKATNADAAEKALLSFERIRWIAGGRPKEGGIAALRPLFPRVAKAYLIGEAAEDFAATLGDTPHVVSGTLDAAVAAALAEAKEGEVILLAPACASFDQFESFEERGRAFEALVRAAIGG